MESQDMLNEFSFKWSSSISEIPNSVWEKIFGKSIIKNLLFFLAVEHSKFVEVSYHYLQVYKYGSILSIVPCFCYMLDFLNITTQSSTKTLIKTIRKIYPRFFKIKVLVTGSYVASCEHFIEYATDITPEDKRLVAELVNQQLKNKSKETRSKFIFIKDIRERSIKYVKEVLDDDFYYFITFPTTAIPILPDCAYPQALKKKNRKRYKKYTEQFDMDFTWKTVTNFSGDYVREFTELYQNVLNKAKNKFEYLNENFFANINISFPENSFLLVAQSHEGETRLMELVLEEDDKLIPLYLGIKYKTDDTKVLYLNAIFRTVKEAEVRKKSYVDFGQTSYYPKVMSGALVENIYYGFWSDHYLLRWLIKNVFKKIFRPTAVLDSVYLNMYKDKAFQILENKGFLLNKIT